jgi:hypothetical protein
MPSVAHVLQARRFEVVDETGRVVSADNILQRRSCYRGSELSTPSDSGRTICEQTLCRQAP